MGYPDGDLARARQDRDSARQKKQQKGKEYRETAHKVDEIGNAIGRLSWSRPGDAVVKAQLIRDRAKESTARDKAHDESMTAAKEETDKQGELDRLEREAQRQRERDKEYAEALARENAQSAAAEAARQQQRDSDTRAEEAQARDREDERER